MNNLYQRLNMSEIYKVTNAKITKSKNGYTIFNLELNNQIWASKLAPIRKLEKKYNRLYQIYEKEQSLSSLIGIFITTSLKKDNYGIKFSSVSHYNSLEEFEELLDKSEKKAFSTDMPIYNFLKSQKYPINADGSITLKNPYDYFNIKDDGGTTICYPNKLRLDELTLENIKEIYYHFYDKKYIDTGSPDRDCKYKLTFIAIVENCKKYHKYKTKTLSDTNSNVIRVGDKLHKEHIKYLNFLKRI